MHFGSVAPKVVLSYGRMPRSGWGGAEEWIVPCLALLDKRGRQEYAFKYALKFG